MSARNALIVLLALLFAVSCTPRRSGGGGSRDDDDTEDSDDDDAVEDDDDAVEDDDDVMSDDDDAVDDDDVVDDDDAVVVEFDFDGLSFSASLTVDGDEAEVEYVFTYWEDMSNGVRNCDQHVQLDGDYLWGMSPPGCDDCTSLLQFDAGSAVDVSNPGSDPDHCDPQLLDDAGANVGEALLTPPEDGWGDFLEVALIDVGTMEVQNLHANVDGSLDPGEIQDGIDDYGLDYTHSGLTEAYDGSLGDASGIAAVADENGTDWHFYFYFFRNPETNPNDGAEMGGEYGGQAHWVINFNP